MTTQFIDSKEYNEWDIYYYPGKNDTLEVLDNFTSNLRLAFGAKEWNVSNWEHQEVPIGKKVFMIIWCILLAPISLLMLIAFAIKAGISASMKQKDLIDVAVVECKIKQIDDVANKYIRLIQSIHIDNINEYFKSDLKEGKVFDIPKEKITQDVKEIVFDTQKELEALKKDCAAHKSDMIKSLVTKLDEKISALEEEAVESANRVVNNCIDHLAQRLGKDEPSEEV